MMARQLITLLILGYLVVPSAAFAQGNVAEAKRLADDLSQQQELPVNVRLRFQLLRDMMGGLAAKGDSTNALTFFSTTRILLWNRPLNPGTGQTMRAFEQQVVALAKDKGFNLDLPPVGYSSAGAAGGAVPVESAASPSSLLVHRSTREGLQQFTLSAEELGTAALAGGSSPLSLLALRDSLTVLRQDLADSQISSDAVRNVLLARAVYLSSPESAGANPQLLQKLDQAAEALRTNFPPEVLRQARGQQLSL